MKPSYSIPMEAIWHGAKSLAYKLGSECFGSTKRFSIECLKLQLFVQGFKKIKASKHTGFAQNHITKVSSFACRPYCLLLLLQHRQQICDTLFCSWISEIQRSKDAFDQLIQELKTSPVVRRKLLVHWTSCTQKELCMDWDFIHITLCYSQQCWCMWSISDKHLEEEVMMRVWEQNNHLKSPITWFRCCKFSCHQTGIPLWEHLLWKQSTSGSWKFFYWHVLYKPGWLQAVDV